MVEVMRREAPYQGYVKERDVNAWISQETGISGRFKHAAQNNVKLAVQCPAQW
jgi:hypothetical protein